MYASAAERNPDNPAAQIRYTRALTREGRIGAARDVITSRLQVTPNQPDLLRELATIDAISGQPDAALARYEKLISSDPQDTDALLNAGVALDLAGNHVEARKRYEQVLKTAPDDLVARNDMAVSAMLDGDFAGAVSILQPVCDGHEVSNRLNNNLAIAYAAMGDMEKAHQFAGGRISDAQLSELAAALRNSNGGGAIVQPATTVPAADPPLVSPTATAPRTMEPGPKNLSDAKPTPTLLAIAETPGSVTPGPASSPRQDDAHPSAADLPVPLQPSAQPLASTPISGSGSLTSAGAVDAAAARPTASADPAHSVTLRTGDHPGYGRVVLDLPAGTEVRTEQNGDHLTLHVGATVSTNRVRAPHNVTSISSVADGISLTLAPGTSVRRMRMSDRLVLDVVDSAEGSAAGVTSPAARANASEKIDPPSPSPIESGGAPESKPVTAPAAAGTPAAPKGAV
jgi:Flp pilus assembly protein TadD